MDAYWLAFYRFGTDLGCRQKPEHLRRLEIMERISASCGFWYPRDGVCIVSERFAGVHWDEARNRQGMPTRLHNDKGPAVSFPDGWPLYYWHGLRIPARLIEDKASITPDAIEAESNAELRRVMLEIFGFDKYIEAREAKVISADECFGLPRTLMEINLKGDRIRVLRVLNGTVEPDGRQRQFHLGVPLDVGTPHEAVAWSYGRPALRHREAVRT